MSKARRSMCPKTRSPLIFQAPGEVRNLPVEVQLIFHTEESGDDSDDGWILRSEFLSIDSLVMMMMMMRQMMMMKGLW